MYYYYYYYMCNDNGLFNDAVNATDYRESNVRKIREEA